MKARILIACEFSGIVRDAFIARGFDAWSCDLLPTDRPGPHIQGDVREHLHRGWDAMIAHPPCTYLCNSSVSWLGERKSKNPKVLTGAARWEAMREGAAFFLHLLDAPIRFIAVENPVMHGHALRLVGSRYDQIIQPYEYGDPYQKATCLWLRRLPKLVPTNIVAGREQKCWREAPSEDRDKIRSETYPGIARAMADQWGSYMRAIMSSAA